MVTAENIKGKIQGLIDKANAKTGGADTTLTAAVDTLASGFGQGGGDDSAEWLNPDCTHVIIPASVKTIPTGCFNLLLEERGTMYKRWAGLPADECYLRIDSKPQLVGQYAFYGLRYGAGIGAFDIDLSECEYVGRQAFYSSFANIIMPTDTITELPYACFYNGCTVDRINLPNVTSIGEHQWNGSTVKDLNVYIGPKCTKISGNAFNFANKNAGHTIIIERAENAISGAPWGNANATIIWTGDE